MKIAHAELHGKQTLVLPVTDLLCPKKTLEPWIAHLNEKFWGKVMHKLEKFSEKSKSWFRPTTPNGPSVNKIKITSGADEIIQSSKSESWFRPITPMEEPIITAALYALPEEQMAIIRERCNKKQYN